MCIYCFQINLKDITGGHSIRENLIYEIVRRYLWAQHLKDWIPAVVMLPTTVSGRLFHRGTAVWMKLLSKQRVLATGKERAWSGIDTLERVARRLMYGGGSKADKSTGQWLVCILNRTVTAATWRLWSRLEMLSRERAVASSTPMILSAFFWMLSSWLKCVGEAFIQLREAYSITLRTCDL